MTYLWFRYLKRITCCTVFVLLVEGSCMVLGATVYKDSHYPQEDSVGLLEHSHPQTWHATHSRAVYAHHGLRQATLPRGLLFYLGH